MIRAVVDHLVQRLPERLRNIQPPGRDKVDRLLGLARKKLFAYRQSLLQYRPPQRHQTIVVIYNKMSRYIGDRHALPALQPAVVAAEDMLVQFPQRRKASPD